MLNCIIVTGNLAEAPKLRRTPSGLAICDVPLICERSIKREGKPPLFIWVSFFGAQAERVSRGFRKGGGIIVTGRLENGEYPDKATGERKTAYFINASSFEFPLTEAKEPLLEAKEPLPKAPASTTAQDDGLDLDDLAMPDGDEPF